MPSSIDVSEKKGVRYLHLGSKWIQGAMRIRSPYKLELSYSREMMLPLLLNEYLHFHASQGHQRDAKPLHKALFIGLGCGSMCKFIYRYFPQIAITVIEILPQMLSVAQQYFELPKQNERFHIEIGDGAEYIQQTTQHFDFIFIDGYDHHGHTGALETLPFYQLAYQRLTQHGLLTQNLFSNSAHFQHTLNNLNLAFDNHLLCFPSVDKGNAVAVASKGDKIHFTSEQLDERAQQLLSISELNLRPLCRRLMQSHYSTVDIFTV